MFLFLYILFRISAHQDTLKLSLLSNELSIYRLLSEQVVTPALQGQESSSLLTHHASLGFTVCICEL